MRLGLICLAILFAACERYTDATSPCFGNDGKPTVSRANLDTLSFATNLSQDCVFEDIGRPQ